MGKATLTIDGKVITVDAPQPFSIVTRIAQGEGLSKVAIYVDGEPLGKDDPETVEPGQRIDVHRDDGGAV